MTFSKLICATLSSILLLCQTCSAAEKQGKLSIVATTGMIADSVAKVAGENATVSGLIGSGVDPHLYKPTRSDILKLSRADVVFYNGLLLEGKMIDAIHRLAAAGKQTFALAEFLDKSYLLEPQGFAGHYDPHVWMDPQAWIKVVETIEEKLSNVDPKNAPAYKRNAKRFIDQLNKLDQYAASVLISVPKDSRILVTAHDAFSYFGRRYGFQVVGIQGISTESEAGVRDIERIVNLLVEKQILAVFVESTVADRNIRALIEGALAQKHSIEIGGQLFSDAMGKSGTYEGTYVGMIDHNVTTISRALGGSAPARGLSDSLGKSKK